MNRLVSLTVGTKQAEEHYTLFQELSELAANLTASHEYVTVSTVRTDEIDFDEAEMHQPTHDENTLLKVRKALRSVLEVRANYISEDLITDMVTEMQNAGILFRERV